VRVLAALIASLTLPFGGVQWWSVAPAGHSLLVTGSPPTGSLCEFYVIKLGTFAGRGPYKRACDKPPVSVHAITPRVGSARNLSEVPVTVAGRVVMRYEDASDTRPQYAWYGHSLWIYDVATTDGSEVLRLDAQTGKLMQRTAMPKVYRPVMVANGDGLWLDPATNGGLSGVSVVPVLHVGFGASKPVVVHRGGRAAMWMAASAHKVWFEQISGRSDVAIWRIDGTKVRLLARPARIGYTAAYGGGRLWELTCGAKEHLLAIDPDRGTLSPVGQLPGNANYCDASLTVTRAEAFVLEGRKLYVYRPRA
jgi:hypothetical protein